MFSKVLKLSCEVSECKPLASGAQVPDAEAPAQCCGRVVQVDPMKPKLKPSDSKRLILRCVVPLSNVAFTFNLRRYTEAFSNTTSRMVGWCRLTPSNPR